MFTPGIGEIAEDLGTSVEVVIGATTGFVIFLGIGPLILAPLSETFGRRSLYLVCFAVFALLQIPTALSPNVECLIAARTISGFFGSMSPLSCSLAYAKTIVSRASVADVYTRRRYCQWWRNNK